MGSVKITSWFWSITKSDGPFNSIPSNESHNFEILAFPKLTLKIDFLKASATIKQFNTFEKAIPKGLPLVFACIVIWLPFKRNISPDEAEETYILFSSSNVIPSGWGIDEEISFKSLGKLGFKLV